MGKLRMAFNSLMKNRHRQGILLAGSRAATPEEYFGFDHREVEKIHFHKTGVGEGLWFRLHDGRVYDEVAKPTCRNPALYDQHPQQ